MFYFITNSGIVLTRSETENLRRENLAEVKAPKEPKEDLKDNKSSK